MLTIRVDFENREAILQTRRKRPAAAWLAAIAVSLIFSTGCGPGETEREAAVGPVVLIGVDGMEWNVALPLIREGRMPALRGLMARGSFGTLATQAPAKSPVIWTTVVTGKGPREHGILDFTRQDADGRLQLYASTDRRSKALWNILGDAGQQSIVVSWWNTFPVEAIEGVMVSQSNTLEQIARRRLIKPGGMARGAPDQVYPPGLEQEMWSTVAEVDREMPRVLEGLLQDLRPGTTPADAANWQACRWSVRADECSRRIALRLARRRPFPDAFLAYFGTPDVVGHRFWRFHEPGAFLSPPSAARVAELGGLVNRAYEHVDAVLGELLAELPEQATIFVISDHGMHAHNTDATFEGPAEARLERESGGHEDGPPGVIVVAGPQIRTAASDTPVGELERADLPELGSVIDIMPTLLALRGVPVGRDMPGSLMTSILDPEWVERLDLELVATHDTAEWLETRAGQGAAEIPGAEERLEQLRSLGYLGGLEEVEE